MIMMPMTDPLGLPMTRMGSGTTWLPDSAPMFGVMRNAGAWMFMMHGSVFVQQSVQGGERGDSQFGSANWGMINAMRAVAGGRLQLRAMGSVDAYTVGGRGYPMLLQTGESYRGESLHDRQHPHDMIMELAAVFERAVSKDVAVQVYLAPAGEPALGPVAFPHRPTAAADPFATISHHWQDATHVSFGVATAGVYTRRVKVEASAFNGREPDGVRTNIDWQGASLDSYAGRVTVAPTASLALSASYGRLQDAEKAHPGEAVRRAVGAALWSRTDAQGGSRSLAFIVGANAVADEAWSRAYTAEALTDIGGKTQLFLRAESVRKSAEELVLEVDHGIELHSASVSSTPASLVSRRTLLQRDVVAAESRYQVAHLTVGALRETALGRFGRIGLGARGTLNLVPSSLEAVYGSRTPLGAAVYVRWRTGRMVMTH